MVKRLRRFIRNLQILYIRATENDVLENTVRGGELVNTISSTLRSVGSDVAQRNGRVLSIDLVKNTDITVFTVGDESYCLSNELSHC